VTTTRLENGSLARYAHHVARFGDKDATEALLSFARGDHPGDLGRQAGLVKAVAQGTAERGGKLPDGALDWAGTVTRRLVDSDRPELVASGIELAGSLRLKSLLDRLSALAGSRMAPEPQRAAAVNALVSIDQQAPITLFGRVLADASEPAGLRDLVAQALARINRTEAQAELLKGLVAAPDRLQNTIASNLASSGRSGAEALLEAVAAGKASPRLLQQRGVEIRLQSSGVPDLAGRLAQLTKGLPPADERLQTLLTQRRSGFAARRADTALGAKVFEKTCASCHELGGKGTRVGPQLDGIGVRGADRLMEDILDPNRNVDLPFRASSLALSNGQVLSGLVLREEGQVIVLADAQGKEQRIGKDTVDERSVTSLSPMPANLVDQLSEKEFYDLIAYLLTHQPPRDEKADTSKAK
jgi:putative heme-binding domain-containing protein